MKKIIKSTLLLAMVIMLTACSTGRGDGDGGNNIVVGNDFLSTGDSVIDAGIVDALLQGSNHIPIIEMTQWQSDLVDDGRDAITKYIQNLFISSDNQNYTKVMVVSVDGKEEYQIGEETTTVIFNNEVKIKSLQEGTLTKTENFKLFPRYSDNETPQITDKKGYTTLYTYTPTKNTSWTSKKVPYESGVWEDTGSGSLIAEYYIVKESVTELSVIKVTKVGDGLYDLPTTSIEEAIKDEFPLTVYKKKQ